MSELSSDERHGAYGGINLPGELGTATSIRFAIEGTDNPSDPYKLVGDVLRVDHIRSSAVDQFLGEALFGSERWRRFGNQLGTEPATWLRGWIESIGTEQWSELSRQARDSNPRPAPDHRQDGGASSTPTLFERVRALEEQLHALQKAVYRVP